MALTWLDHYARSMWQVVRDLNLPVPSGSVWEAARGYVDLTLANKDAIQAKGAAEGHSHGLSHVLMAHCAFPYLHPEVGIRSLALQLSEDLADDFADAEPPERIDYLAILNQYDSIYLDLPPDRFLVHERHHLRALFWEKGRLQFIMPINGRQQLVDLQVEASCNWDANPDQEWIPFHYMETDAGKGFLKKEVPHVREDFEIHFPTVQRQAQNLMKLALLYFTSSDVEQSFLPVASKERSSNPKKAVAKLHEKSLFKIARLVPPADRFGRDESEAAESKQAGRSIGVRYHVRGHFFNQAIGKGWKEHRIRWRKGGWRGPEDGQVQPELHILK